MLIVKGRPPTVGTTILYTKESGMYKNKLSTLHGWESRVRGAVTRSRAAAEAQRTTQVAR